MRVDNQASDLVVLIGDQRLFEKAREGQIGQAHLRRNALASLAATMPARQSPDRSGVALAMSDFEVVEPVAGSANVYRIHRKAPGRRFALG